MAAVANNPAFAKKAGVPQSVGKDFSNADKGKTFKQGGDMATKMNPGFMAMMAKKKESKPMGKPTMKPGMSTAKDGMKKPMGDMMGMKKGGMHKMPDGKMMKDSAMKKMNTGGMPMVMKDGKKVPAFAAKKMMGGGMAYSKGGSASSRADGIATKGKTKGKMLSKGGATKKYC